MGGCLKKPIKTHSSHSKENKEDTSVNIQLTSSPPAPTSKSSSSTLTSASTPTKVEDETVVNALHENVPAVPISSDSQENSDLQNTPLTTVLRSPQTEVSPVHTREPVGPVLTSFTITDPAANNLRYSATISIISSSSSSSVSQDEKHSEDDGDAFDSDDDQAEVASLSKPPAPIRKVSFSSRSVASRSSAATSASVLALRISSNYYAAGGIVGGIVVGEGDEDSDDEQDEPAETATPENQEESNVDVGSDAIVDTTLPSVELTVVVGNEVSSPVSNDDRVDLLSGDDGDLSSDGGSPMLKTNLFQLREFSQHGVQRNSDHDTAVVSTFDTVSETPITLDSPLPHVERTVEEKKEFAFSALDDFMNMESNVEEDEGEAEVIVHVSEPQSSEALQEVVLPAPDVVPENDESADVTRNSNDLKAGQQNSQIDPHEQTPVAESMQATTAPQEADASQPVKEKEEVVRFMSVNQILQQQQQQTQRTVSKDMQEHEEAKRRHFLQLGRATLVNSNNNSGTNLSNSSSDTNISQAGSSASNNDTTNTSNAKRNTNASNEDRKLAGSNNAGSAPSKLSLYQKSMKARQQLRNNAQSGHVSPASAPVNISTKPGIQQTEDREDTQPTTRMTESALPGSEHMSHVSVITGEATGASNGGDTRGSVSDRFTM